MTEKELQKLFQKKFADREVPYNPGAWTRLEKMLDKAATPWYARQSFIYQSAAVLTSIVLSTAIYFNWPESRQDLNNPEKTNSELSVDEAFPSTGQSIDKKEVRTQNEAVTDITNDRPLNEGDTQPLLPSISDAVSTSPHSDLTSSAIVQQSAKPASSFQASGSSSWAQTPALLGDNASEKDVITLQLVVRDVLPAETLTALAAVPEVTSFASVDHQDHRIEPLVAPKLGMRSDFHWSLSGLIGFGSALNNQKSTSNGLASWGLGTEIRWAFHPEFAVSSGINFSRRSDLALLRKYEGVTYGFGANRQVVEVIANSGDFLEMPVMLNYFLGKGHTIKAGYYAAYLLNVRNEVNTHSKGMYDDTWTSESRNASGYEDSFHSLDHGWIFGYEWAWDPRWSVGADYLLGLQDLSKDEVYVDTRQHYNRQLRFRISYSLQ